MANDNARLPGISILSWFLLTSLHYSQNDVKKSKKTKCCQMKFTEHSTRLFHGFYGIVDRKFDEIIWNARITITYVCFSALTCAGSLGRSLNTGPSVLVFNQLPREPVNVNAWKNMFDPYNLGNCLVNTNCVENRIFTTVLVDFAILLVNRRIQAKIYYLGTFKILLCNSSYWLN